MSEYDSNIANDISDAAMKAAEKLVTVDDVDIYVGGFYGFRCFRHHAPMTYAQKVKMVLAEAIDDHTTALRAEVERLREWTLRGGWYRSDQTLPPFNVRVRLWTRFLEDGKLSRGEESHGTRIAVFKSEGWAREWIWDTPDGTTDESEDYGRRYTHWQYITPPEGE